MPAIAFWNSERLEKRELQEIKNGGFGKGELRELYDDKHVDYNFDAEEEIDENVNKADEDLDEDMMVRFTCLSTYKDETVVKMYACVHFFKSYVFLKMKPLFKCTHVYIFKKSYVF